MNNPIDTWLPPFCPNPDCRFHGQDARSWRFARAGTYRRQAAPNRIRRFRCLDCGRHFSTQTFSVTYWLKRPAILPEVYRQTTSCAANRQIAHNLKVAPDTVDRAVGRLGRHCLLVHQEIWGGAPPDGPVAIDGFETFEWSQFYPFHVNVAVEVECGMFSFFTESELRRKGRMTPWQRRRRAQLEIKHGRPDPGAVGRGVGDLLGVVLKHAGQAVIRSDDHPAYRAPIAQAACPIRHEVTPSRVRRDGNNALCEVNLLDGWLRHASANHKRETIAWSKRRQCAMDRMAIILVDRNYLRSRVKKRGGPSPGMLKGLIDHRMEVAELLDRRRFPGRIPLPAPWDAYYRGLVRTRALAVNRGHALKYAF